jgi:hypothetical protein
VKCLIKLMVVFWITVEMSTQLQSGTVIKHGHFDDSDRSSRPITLFKIELV